PGEVHAGDGGIRGFVGVRIRIDDERVLAAQLEGERLDAAFRGRALDRHAGGDRAGKADALDPGMAHDRVARRNAVAGHDIDDAGGRISLQISPRMVAESELVSGGFITTVLPATSGPASPRAAKLSG